MKMSENDWRQHLEQSKAQIAAGERVALLPVLERLREVADRLEARAEDASAGIGLPAAE